ncbi:MAG: prenyltransferase [Armatimonadota bacterium]|nr:MAG: prenyltransferase [Armatimonadota bacterium]
MSAVRPTILGSAALVLEVSRPKFWLYLAGTYLVGCAAGSARPADLVTLRFWVCLGYFLIPANVLLYGVNDLADGTADRINPRKRGSEHVLEVYEERVVLRAVLAALFLALPVLAVLSGHVEQALLGGFIALAILYSVPPVRLKAAPVLDAASNVLYALPLFLGFHQFAGELPNTEVIAISFLWTAAMHIFSAALDIDTDRRSGLRTTASALGYRGSLLVCAALWIAVFVLVAGYRILHPWGLAAICYPLIPLLLMVRPAAAGLQAYRLFPALNAIAGMAAFFVAVLRT